MRVPSKRRASLWTEYRAQPFRSVELREPFLRVSLVRKRPAAQYRTVREIQRKSLIRREAESSFHVRLSRMHFAAKLMEPSRLTQGHTDAQGMGTLLRQRHRLGASRQPLVRIAQTPQCPRATAAAYHPSVLAMEEDRRAVLLEIVTRDPLGKVCVRRGGHSEGEQDRPQRAVRCTEHGCILHLLRQCQELLSQVMRHLQLTACTMAIPQST
jgi:hypothetical protein